MGTVASVELQRTPAEIDALISLIEPARDGLSFVSGASWDREGREWERLCNIGAVLAWGREPANAPPDTNPYSRDAAEQRIAGDIAAEGPFVTPERITEIRNWELGRCKTTVQVWAELAPARTPEALAALRWLLGGACPVGEHGFTGEYQRRVA